MILELILEESSESKIDDFEKRAEEGGYEKVVLKTDTALVGPNKSEVRAVIKRNIEHRPEGKMLIITDDPNLIKIANESVDIDNVHVK